MLKSMITSGLFLATLGTIAVLQATPARAVLPSSVWVANYGADTVDCGPIATPCASLYQANRLVANGGQIGFLTPGEYIGVNIDGSLHIANDGVGEVIILAGTESFYGFVLLAGPGAVVSIRGLVIDGQGNGIKGIQGDNVGALHIQNCFIRNFEAAGGSTFGISFAPSRASQLFISDTLIFNNGSVSLTAGILVEPQRGGQANVVLDRVHLENNVDGLLIVGSLGTGAGARVLVRDSVFSGNAANGIHALTAAGASAAFEVVERSSFVNNAGVGILTDGPRATVLLKDSTLTLNGTGVSTVNGGQLISYGTNTNNNNLGPEGAATGFYSG